MAASAVAERMTFERIRDGLWRRAYIIDGKPVDDQLMAHISEAQRGRPDAPVHVFNLARVFSIPTSDRLA